MVCNKITRQMVTAFLRFGALARLQTGYKRQATPNQAQKNPPRRVFLRVVRRITWVPRHLPLGQNHPQQARKHLLLEQRPQQRAL